jgi:hypothetical protein
MTLVQQIEHLIRENRELKAHAHGHCLQCEAYCEEIKALKECLIEAKHFHQHEHDELAKARADIRILQADIAHERLAYKNVYNDLDAVVKALEKVRCE